MCSVMQEEIGSYEAKTNLPEILRRVDSGESFTITNRGRPVADIVPSRAGRRLKAQTAIENILNARKHLVSEEALSELKQYGRK